MSAMSYSNHARAAAGLHVSSQRTTCSTRRRTFTVARGSCLLGRHRGRRRSRLQCDSEDGRTSGGCQTPKRYPLFLYAAGCARDNNASRKRVGDEVTAGGAAAALALRRRGARVTVRSKRSTACQPRDQTPSCPTRKIQARQQMSRPAARPEFASSPRSGVPFIPAIPSRSMPAPIVLAAVASALPRSPSVIRAGCTGRRRRRSRTEAKVRIQPVIALHSVDCSLDNTWEAPGYSRLEIPSSSPPVHRLQARCSRR